MERGPPTGGEWERHGRTRAGDGGRGGHSRPPHPRKAPALRGATREAARVGDQATRGKRAGITPHTPCAVPPRTPAAAEPTRNQQLPGKPKKAPTRGRTRCAHTDADRRRPSSGSGSRRPTTRRTRPTAGLPQRDVRPPRARPVPRDTDPSLAPRRGRGLPRSHQPWERHRGRGSEATTAQVREHTARNHERDARAAVAAPRRGREQEGRTRRKARERTGDEWDREPTAKPFRFPSHRDPRWKGRRAAHAGMCTALPQPPTTATTDPHSSGTGGRTTSSAPRDPSPNSERGGAGRCRDESKRCAQIKRRVTGGHSRRPYGRKPPRGHKLTLSEDS